MTEIVAQNARQTQRTFGDPGCRGFCTPSQENISQKRGADPQLYRAKRGTDAIRSATASTEAILYQRLDSVDGRLASTFDGTRGQRRTIVLLCGVLVLRDGSCRSTSTLSSQNTLSSFSD